MLKRTLLIIMMLLIPAVGLAMDSDQQQRFDQVMKMKMAQLTEATDELLEQKFPDHDWDQYNFPDYAYLSDSVEMGYRVAVVAPELLGKLDASATDQGIPCYCFCDAMGHRDLLACFLKDGKLNNGYDDHASACNICYGQAMIAFLWQDAGATHEEILAGMKVKFARLIKMREEQGK
jgi:hypothetical protein